jgi:hypothetical protein
MGATNFWGTDGQYKYLHRWIGKTAGKPDYCEQADETCKGKFEWANKSGEYLKVVTDWVRLCRSHHRRFDDAVSTHAVLRPKTQCKNGHEFTPENTRIVDTGRGRTAKRCLTCRRVKDLEYYYKRRAAYVA